MYYVSNYTDFTASEPPYTNKIFCKDGNRTVAIIHIDDNWNMWGEVIDPFNLWISPIKPIYTNLTQEQCEKMLLKDVPKPNRKDILREYNMKEMDYAKFMYCTRLINLINNYWLAWSEDDEPPTPYWKPDWENDNLFNKSEEIPEWVKGCTFE